MHILACKMLCMKEFHKYRESEKRGMSMKYIRKISLLFYISIMSNPIALLPEGSFVETKPVGQRYFEFVKLFTEVNREDFSQELAKTFAADVTKIINGRLVCTNSQDMLRHMKDVKNKHGISNVVLHELIRSDDNRANVIRWDITYKDNTTESIITIVKYTNDNLITEINGVFGDKGIYDWQAQ
jgi:hypothetical protein